MSKPKVVPALDQRRDTSAIAKPSIVKAFNCRSAFFAQNRRLFGTSLSSSTRLHLSGGNEYVGVLSFHRSRLTFLFLRYRCVCQFLFFSIPLLTQFNFKFLISKFISKLDFSWRCFLFFVYFITLKFTSR